MTTRFFLASALYAGALAILPIGCKSTVIHPGADETCETCPGAAPEEIPVQCEWAVQGDPCALGESCSDYSLGECEVMVKVCDPDDGWQVSIESDGTDDCQSQCWDDECCEPICCPEHVPANGTLCDSCSDSDACSLVVETECGRQETVFGCDPMQAVWVVSEPPPCEM